jgi:hypothetical protein
MVLWHLRGQTKTTLLPERDRNNQCLAKFKSDLKSIGDPDFAGIGVSLGPTKSLRRYVSLTRCSRFCRRKLWEWYSYHSSTWLLFGL